MTISPRKIFNKLPVILFAAFHYSFLIAAIFENRSHPVATFILLAITLLISIFYFRNLKFKTSVFKKIDLLIIVFTALGAVVTYWLNISTEIGVVLAAGITGLISSFLPLINRRSEILRELPVAIYCGAFAGMTSPLVANGYNFILATGILSGIILVSTKSTLHGYGGKLGTIAFGGVALISLILFLLT